LKIISSFEITEKMDTNTTPVKKEDLAPPFPKVDKVDQYIAQLDDIQRKAYEIAKSHLGTSFNIKRSNGYIEWLKKQPV
jgi:hypothetical protein